jgi:hypothetical protein
VKVAEAEVANPFADLLHTLLAGVDSRVPLREAVRTS